ncbi:AraC family transcriptional regulator [Vibrio sp. qd031]|uniref:helix-turn-helix domain-containing protein n=1 Tax=Vibrio sp. qd031 TaxID=1603038 RepID=UPI000A104CFD|nr:AraC family transcriptional regulator [Vibrio sp. qd031]ORT50568.1 AraC family transcriptional regulator [Vibrio sp. qd031]
MHTINDFKRVTEREYALSTDSLNLLYYDLPQYFDDCYHSYDSPRLCTILTGTKEVKVNQSDSFQYDRTEFVLLPPNATVHMSMPSSTKALVYEFSDQLIDGVVQQVVDNLEVDSAQYIDCNSFSHNKINNRLGELHQRMQQIVAGNDTNMRFLLNLTCQEVVYELLRKQSCHSILYQAKNHPINQAIRLMKSSHHQSISEIAEEVGLSLSNFSQKFKAVTESTPKDYVRQLRLQRSQKLLETLSVTDAAMEVGYDNISHYIRLFKMEFGVTPKQYQLQYQIRA